MFRFEKMNINKNKIKSKDKRTVRLTAGIKKINRNIKRLGLSKKYKTYSLNIFLIFVIKELVNAK